MAFDMNNQDIMALIAQLGGGNDLVNPPLANMPTNMDAAQMPQQQMDTNGMLPNMGDPNSMASQLIPQQAPRLSENYPANFQGMGMGAEAPKVTEGDVNQMLLAKILSQVQGMGGF